MCFYRNEYSLWSLSSLLCHLGLARRLFQGSYGKFRLQEGSKNSSSGSNCVLVLRLVYKMSYSCKKRQRCSALPHLAWSVFQSVFRQLLSKCIWSSAEVKVGFQTECMRVYKCTKYSVENGMIERGFNIRLFFHLVKFWF